MAIITINEINKTTRLTTVDTTMPIIAIIGPSTFGPLNTPTELYNEEHFNEVFGEELCANSPYAAIAAKRYLSQNGCVLFTRISSNTAAAASYIVPDMIAITANYPGTIGNQLRITMKSAIINGVTTYKVSTIIGRTQIVADLANFTIDELLLKGSIKMQYITISALDGLTIDSVIPNLEMQMMSGGNDGDVFFTTEENNQTETNKLISDLETITQQLADKQIYEFAIIAMPGISGAKNTSSNQGGLLNGNTVVDQFLSLTTQREDCVAIIDPHIDSNYAEVLMDLLMEEISSQYLAIFYPWYNAAVTELNRTILMPPSVFYLDACATSFKVNKPWNAVAGPLAGTCSNCKSTTVLVGSSMSRALNEMFINPIVYNRNFGYYLDGNNVLNPASETRTYSQLGIRQAINYAKRELAKICHAMSYKQNSSLVRSEVLGRVSGLLEGLKAGEAIYGYRAYINESDVDMAEGIIRLTVKIYPTPALEEFIFDFEIVNSESAL